MATHLSFHGISRNRHRLWLVPATLQIFMRLLISNITWQFQRRKWYRANKKINRHIWNILFDREIQELIKNAWPVEKILSPSIKQPLGVSPNNTLLVEDAFHRDTSLLGSIDQDTSSTSHTFRASGSSDWCSHSIFNNANLRRRYSHYPCSLQLHPNFIWRLTFWDDWAHHYQPYFPAFLGLDLRRPV